MTQKLTFQAGVCCALASFLLLSFQIASAALSVAQPWTIRSDENHVLDVTFIDQVASTEVAGRSNVLVRAWNGSYVAPILRVKKGDRIIIRLNNSLDCCVYTNIHFHGMEISPSGTADDSFRQVAMGEQWIYNFTVPLTHSTGLFWYHSHAMNEPDPNADAQWQVYNGMSGVLIVEGILDGAAPELVDCTERILALRDVYINETSGQIPEHANRGIIDTNLNTTKMVNGVVYPASVDVRRNETQFWRVANIGTDYFYTIAFVPELPMYRLAVDGQKQNVLVTNNSFLLWPGGRMEFFVQIPQDAPNSYTFKSLRTVIDGSGENVRPYNETSLLDVNVSGETSQPLLELPTAIGSFGAPADLTLPGVTITGSFDVVFDIVSDGISTNFTINGKLFEMDRNDRSVKVGDIERWTLINESPEYHVFHIHQLDFQVVSINGENQPFTGYQDTVIVPWKANNIPGKVVIIVPFLNKEIVGKFLFHCHMMIHEDRGMMAALTVDTATQTESGQTRVNPHSTLIALLIGLIFAVSV